MSHPAPPNGGPTLEEIAQRLGLIWIQLRAQLTATNNIIQIGIELWNNLQQVERDWIVTEYAELFQAPSMYLQDSSMRTIFLGQVTDFPSMHVVQMAAGMLPIFLAENHLPIQLATPTGQTITAVDDDDDDDDFEDEEQNDVASPLASKALGKKGKVPRPANAFILYRKDQHPKVKAANPGIHNNDISVILGKQWNNETAAVRNRYKVQADTLKQEHLASNPGYQYCPRKTHEKKRRQTKRKIAAQQAMAIRTPEPIIAALETPASSFVVGGVISEGRMNELFSPTNAQLGGNDPTLLGGHWQHDRYGILPATNDQLELVEQHNSINFQFISNPAADRRMDHFELPTLGPSNEYRDLQLEDMELIDWDEVNRAMQPDGDAAEICLNNPRFNIGWDFNLEVDNDFTVNNDFAMNNDFDFA